MSSGTAPDLEMVSMSDSSRRWTGWTRAGIGQPWAAVLHGDDEREVWRELRRRFCGDDVEMAVTPGTVPEPGRRLPQRRCF
jgi:hypothetical protein